MLPRSAPWIRPQHSQKAGPAQARGRPLRNFRQNLAVDAWAVAVKRLHAAGAANGFAGHDARRAVDRNDRAAEVAQHELVARADADAVIRGAVGVAAAGIELVGAGVRTDGDLAEAEHALFER